MQVEHPGPGQPGHPGPFLGRGQLALRQPLQVTPAVDDQLEGVGLPLEVVFVFQLQEGQLGVQGPQPGLAGRGQFRPAPAEPAPGRLQQGPVLRVQAGAAGRVDPGDPREQGGVGQEIVLVVGEHRGDGQGDPVQGLVRVQLGHGREHRRNPVQGGAAGLEGRDGVPEARRLGVLVDGPDLLHLSGQRRPEGGPVMFGLDLVERRHPEGRRPLREERVGLGGGRGAGAGHRIDRRRSVRCRRKRENFNKCEDLGGPRRRTAARPVPKGGGSQVGILDLITFYFG